MAKFSKVRSIIGGQDLKLTKQVTQKQALDKQTIGLGGTKVYEIQVFRKIMFDLVSIGEMEEDYNLDTDEFIYTDMFIKEPIPDYAMLPWNHPDIPTGDLQNFRELLCWNPQNRPPFASQVFIAQLERGISVAESEICGRIKLLSIVHQQILMLIIIKSFNRHYIDWYETQQNGNLTEIIGIIADIEHKIVEKYTLPKQKILKVINKNTPDTDETSPALAFTILLLCEEAMQILLNNRQEFKNWAEDYLSYFWENLMEHSTNLCLKNHTPKKKEELYAETLYLISHQEAAFIDKIIVFLYQNKPINYGDIDTFLGNIDLPISRKI